MSTEDRLLLIVPPLVGAVLGILAGMLIRRLLIPRLTRWAARTATSIDDALIAAVRTPLVLWCGLIGLHVGLGMTQLPAPTRTILSEVIIVLLGLSVTWTAARIVSASVRAAGGHGAAFPSARILTNAAQIGVFLIGILVTLATLGISITPLLAALGVGGLAVGLALQDTLANLFAGFHLLVSRQVRPSDYVRIESGQEGYVEDITWRYTTIRQPSNNLVIVPNSRLASAVTFNFSRPDSEQAVLVEVAVTRDDDLGEVERITTEVARDTQREVAGGVPEFTPIVRFHTLGDTTVTFTVVLRGHHYSDHALIKSEFLKRLVRRYRYEGINATKPQAPAVSPTANVAGAAVQAGAPY